MYAMTQEQLSKIILNDQLIKELSDWWVSYNRLERNRMMYRVFTPFYIQWWHKLIGHKPYLNFNYQPKL